MKIHAFHGQRFAQKHGDPGDWAAPPFDQISAALGARLRQDPNHFAHLTRPDPTAEDSHGLSQTTLQGWVEQGHVISETSPCLYLYETELRGGGSRLGLCALAEVGHGDIRPHEQTVDKTVEERLALLRRVATDLEPVFLLVDDGGRLNRLLASESSERAVRTEDADGNLHSIQPIGSRIDDYKDALEGIDGLIADGHHRTRVATLHAQQTGALGSSAAGCKLVIIVSLASPGLTIDPIHRAWIDPIELELMERFVVTRATAISPNAAEFCQQVAGGSGPTVGVWQRSRTPEIWTLDAEAIRAESASPVPDLPVALFHAAFPALGWDPTSATDGTITYRSNPKRLAQEMDAGAFAASLWLPPMSAEAFCKALEVVQVLPPKSTRFLPKLVSGMVWSPHHQDIL